MACCCCEEREKSGKGMHAVGTATGIRLTEEYVTNGTWNFGDGYNMVALIGVVGNISWYIRGRGNWVSCIVYGLGAFMAFRIQHYTIQ